MTRLIYLIMLLILGLGFGTGLMLIGVSYLKKAKEMRQ